MSSDAHNRSNQTSTAVDIPVDDGAELWIAEEGKWTVSPAVVEGEVKINKKQLPAAQMQVQTPSVQPPQVEVRRSHRRRRTVSAHREGERIVVLVPDRLTRAEEKRWVEQMVGTVLDREARALVRGPKAGDEALTRRASQLSDALFGGTAVPASIRWVDNMNQRWGSCTPTDRTIRISVRLRDFPDWVLDYVIVHELAHLLVAGHGPKFWALVERYERTERARGFLHGWSSARGQTESTDED